MLIGLNKLCPILNCAGPCAHMYRSTKLCCSLQKLHRVLSSAWSLGCVLRIVIVKSAISILTCTRLVGMSAFACPLPALPALPLPLVTLAGVCMCLPLLSGRCSLLRLCLIFIWPSSAPLPSHCLGFVWSYCALQLKRPGAYNKSRHSE